MTQRTTINSQGVAFVHNLIAGTIHNDRHDKRSTPFQVAYATGITGLYPAANGDSGDHQFYNHPCVAPASD